MLYFSSLLKSSPQYSLSAKNLFSALSDHGETFRLFDGAKDIWARDYMPVKTPSGKYVSFRYEPSYLKNHEQQQTDYCKDVAPYFNLPQWADGFGGICGALCGRNHDDRQHLAL